MKIRIHALEPISRANGPGKRFVIWTQGCSRGCPGCFNPQTHDPSFGYDMEVQELFSAIKQNCPNIEGVTVSGGEPLQQPQALLELLTQVKAMQLNVVLFSGHTLQEIKAEPHGQKILQQVDLLVTGPYVESLPTTAPLLGSGNQRIHFLTDRYQESDLAHIPRSEIFLQPDGSLRMSGMRRLTGEEKRCNE